MGTGNEKNKDKTEAVRQKGKQLLEGRHFLGVPEISASHLDWPIEWCSQDSDRSRCMGHHHMYLVKAGPPVCSCTRHQQGLIWRLCTPQVTHEPRLQERGSALLRRLQCSSETAPEKQQLSDSGKNEGWQCLCVQVNGKRGNEGMKQEEREELLKLMTLAEERICSYKDILGGNLKDHNYH